MLFSFPLECLSLAKFCLNNIKSKFEGVIMVLLKVSVPARNDPISKLHHSIQIITIPATASLINCPQSNRLSMVQPKCNITGQII